MLRSSKPKQAKVTPTRKKSTPADSVFYLRSGKVKLAATSEQGKWPAIREVGTCSKPERLKPNSLVIHRNVKRYTIPINNW
jgi:hypothetical protein